MACGGMIFIKNFNFWKKKISFYFILFYFLCCLCYYCSINVKKQSEFSGLRPDTSSLVLFVHNCIKLKLINFFFYYIFFACFYVFLLIQFFFAKRAVYPIPSPPHTLNPASKPIPTREGYIWGRG